MSLLALTSTAKHGQFSKDVVSVTGEHSPDEPYVILCSSLYWKEWTVLKEHSLCLMCDMGVFSVAIVSPITSTSAELAEL